MARVVASLAVWLVALFMTGAAWAHATLLSSDPADGSVLSQSPKMVQLQFDEIVAPGTIRLIDAEGKAREVATRAVGQSVLIVMPDDLPQGTQIVSYRVVSEDGHPVADTRHPAYFGLIEATDRLRGFAEGLAELRTTEIKIPKDRAGSADTNR